MVIIALPERKEQLAREFGIIIDAQRDANAPEGIIQRRVDGTTHVYAEDWARLSDLEVFMLLFRQGYSKSRSMLAQWYTLHGYNAE